MESRRITTWLIQLKWLRSKIYDCHLEDLDSVLDPISLEWIQIRFIESHPFTIYQRSID